MFFSSKEYHCRVMSRMSDNDWFMHLVNFALSINYIFKKKNVFRLCLIFPGIFLAEMCLNYNEERQTK